MGDTENTLPPSKKRAAGRELSRDNPGLDDEEDVPEQETGTFKKASEEVLASRRIVKVRRNQTTSTPSSNPFAGIRLVPLTEPTATPAEVTDEALVVSEKTVTDEALVVSEKTDTDEALAASEKTGTDEALALAASEKTGTDEALAASEKKVSEDGKNDANTETETVKDEDNKQSESKIDVPVAEVATGKESAEDQDSDIVDKATKPEADKDEAAGGDKTDNEDKKDDCSGNVNPSAEGTPLSSFQQLSSSQNAFTGLAGTGFSTSTFSFGSIPKDGSVLGSSSGSLFGQKTEQQSFGFGLSNNGNSSLFNTPGASIISKGEGSGFPSMQEVSVETGEENESVVFSADSVLFEFLDGGWKERGKGEIKVNVSKTEAERARLVMRARGNYRLILNASIYPDMKLTNMEKKGITFACMNSNGEGKDGLSTFALKFKDGSIVEDFCAAVTAHQAKTATVLKTPENSPKALDG